MSHILVVAQHRGHDTIGEIIQCGGGEDDASPVWLLLILRASSFIVLLANPGQNAHWIVIEAEADGMRLEDSQRTILISTHSPAQTLVRMQIA